MANSLNVYKGPDSIRNYFDPDTSPPLPLVEIPDSLNPYRRDGIRIYAKMMSMHPANNVKSMPALNLLENAVKPGQTQTVIEYSSGSTVISMSLVAQAFYGISDVRAYLSNKTSLAKLRLMQFFNLDITLFGGPSQPEPDDDRGGIRAAARMAAESDSVINPNQYENDNNWKSHVRWTGPQILRQLPEIDVICAGMGTSGTMTGLGTFFKTAKPSVYRIGVCTAPGDRVPGPRSHALLAPVEFPWKSSIDHMEEVGSHHSYTLSLDLCRQGLVCGPSSGFNLQGLYQSIEKRKAAGSLKDLANRDGEIHCVFLCCDLPYQYIDEYFEKLGADYFPTIHNQSLTKVDLHRYDDKWEREPVEALDSFLELGDVLSNWLAPITLKVGPKPGRSIIDLRQPLDFQSFSLPGSINVPLVQEDTASPFSDSQVLESLWSKLEETFNAPSEDLEALLHGSQVLVLCYDGDSARVATSVLRAKGHVADSLKGGFRALRSLREMTTDGPRCAVNRPVNEGIAVATQVI